MSLMVITQLIIIIVRDEHVFFGQKSRRSKHTRWLVILWIPAIKSIDVKHEHNDLIHALITWQQTCT